MTRKPVRPMGYPRCAFTPADGARGQGGAKSDMKYFPNVMPTLGDKPRAMVYPQWQEFRELYSLEDALCRGTLFKELDKPFCY